MGFFRAAHRGYSPVHRYVPNFSDLPDGWEESTAPNGKKYYWYKAKDGSKPVRRGSLLSAEPCTATRPVAACRSRAVGAVC